MVSMSFPGIVIIVDAAVAANKTPIVSAVVLIVNFGIVLLAVSIAVVVKV